MQRSTVIDAFDAGPPIVLLVAPAGYGKTTAWRAWVERNPDQVGGEAAFGAAGRGGAAAMAAALAHAVAAVGGDPPRPDLLLASGQRCGEDYLLATADSLRRLDGPTMVFMDDVHLLSAELSRELGRLVSLVADGQHRFAVASRDPLPWPTERWRVNGTAVRITAEDLSLTSAELPMVIGTDDEDLLDSFLRTTGGWPAAVEVLRWHLTEHGDAPLDEAVTDMVAFIEEEVLRTLAPDELLLLRRSAVLSSIEPRIAGSLADLDGAERRLRALARRTSLLTDRGDRFEIHPLLREALRRQLGEADGEAEDELHARAARAWLEHRSDHAMAMEHLLAGERWDEALHLLLESWRDVLADGQLDLASDWIERLPRHQWADEASLALSAAAANLSLGRLDRARKFLAAPAVMANPVGRAAAKLVEAQATWWSTSPAEALRLAAEGVELLDQLPPDADVPPVPGYRSVRQYRILGELCGSRALSLTGRFAESTERCEQLLADPRRLGAISEVSARSLLAWNLSMTGAVGRARAEADAALVLAEQHTFDHVAILAPAHLALAVVAHSTNRPEAAHSHLESAAVAGRRAQAAALLRFCELVGALCGDPHPDPHRGQHEHRVELPLVDQVVLAARARDLVRRGDVAGATDLARTVAPHELTVGWLTEVQLAHAGADAVGPWLHAVPGPTTHRGRIVRLMAEAAVLAAGDRQEESTALVVQAAGLAKPERLRGLLLDAPVQLWDHLERATASGHGVRTLVAEARRLSAGTPVTPFSPRELEVLALLDGPALAREMAEDLFVSTNTVRWYLGRVYRKLGVGDRASAVARARDLGLI